MTTDKLIARQANWREWVLLLITSVTLFLEANQRRELNRHQRYVEFDVAYTAIMSQIPFTVPDAITRMSDEQFARIREESIRVARLAPTQPISTTALAYTIAATSYRIARHSSDAAAVAKAETELFECGQKLSYAVLDFGRDINQ